MKKRKKLISFIVICLIGIVFCLIAIIDQSSIGYNRRLAKAEAEKAEQDAYYQELARQQNKTLIYVEGVSMEPTIPNGSYVYIDKEQEPQYGDIVTFFVGSEPYIKRIVGVPGDTIEVDDGKFFRNGEEDERYKGKLVQRWRQSQDILGDDEYFVVGDNVECSKDSRYFGPIKRDQIEGVFVGFFTGK